jgi:SAM-dependent methyltransferase
MPEAPAAADSELWDLQQLAEARGLCDWMFDQFRDRVGPDVVEVGAGIGTFTDRLLAEGAQHVLTIEPEAACADELERRYRDDPRVSMTRELLPDSPALAARAGEVDLVLCQNVLEHVEHDAAAVAAMARALRPGGTLALLVPAHQRLYGVLDRQYGHFRRYDRQRVRSVVEGAGLQIDDLYSFNLLGVPGWLVKNRLSEPSLDGGSLRAYEALLKLWRPVEDRFRFPWGLSLIAIARRPAA